MDEVVVKKKKKGIQYFTQDTEDAIVLYNNTTDFELKSRIYNDKIHYGFFKLTENIIHTFKFYYTEVDNIEDLQHEVITFLLSKIHLFDQSKGAKAFSYFGTIAKRYLILSNQKNYKKRVETSPVASIEEDEKFSYQLDDTKSVVESNLSKFMDEYINYCTDNIFELFPKETDAQVADAILEVFRKRDSLDVFNKKALYIYIREMIDVKTPKITKIADQLYDIFKKKYVFYLEHGYTNF
jgi:DNA-directed RNA polymerase specialized sigma24 family protein